MSTDEFTKQVLDDRKRRNQERRDEARTLSRYKKKLKARFADRDWPQDARTGDRAEIDHDDVMAPLPDDMKSPIGNVDERMQELRKVADTQQAFAGDVVPIDRGVMLRRQEERTIELAARAKVQGSAWTADLVEARIEEAFRTLFRSSGGRVGPREFGNGMPQPIRQMSDLVAQAGNKSLRRAMQRLARDQGPPSTEEVKRMDEALTWAVSYLKEDHPDLAMFVNLGGMWKAWGAKVTKKCREIGVHRQVFYRDRKEAVKRIVEGLVKDGKAPT